MYTDTARMELKQKDVAAKTSESQVPAMYPCGTADLEPQSLPAHSLGPTTELAFIPTNRIWMNKSELMVKFLNDIPKEWKYRGRSIDKSMIFSWANVWHDRSEGIVPKFVHAGWRDTPDIRIRLNSKGKNETRIGIEAQNVPRTEPTMWLDLSYSGYDNDDNNDAYMKYLVIHEFGHALGLLHEHQKSDFWRIIKPYIDEQKIIKSFGHEMFHKDWTVEKSFPQTVTSEYDPKSIMHYWFDKGWLKAKYSSIKLVEAEYNEHELTEDERKYLLGVHERQDLAKEPSKIDIEFLLEAYRSTAVDQESAVVVTCRNCRSGCVVI